MEQTKNQIVTLMVFLGMSSIQALAEPLAIRWSGESVCCQDIIS
jgi:hypothetical protein